LGFVASPLRLVGGEGGGEVAANEFAVARRSREPGAEIFAGGSPLVSSGSLVASPVLRMRFAWVTVTWFSGFAALVADSSRLIRHHPGTLLRRKDLRGSFVALCFHSRGGCR